MPHLIALTGQMKSGKNTAATAIRENAEARGLSVCERGFADLLKWSAMRLFIPTITRDDAIEMANAMKFSSEKIEYGGEPARLGNAGSLFSPETYEIAGTPPTFSITGRELLQRYGTESHRGIFGDNFWVDRLLPLGGGDRGENIKWPCQFENADVCLITDLRFENEAFRVSMLGGQIWRIVRPDLPPPEDHQSERPLPDAAVNGTIVNDTDEDSFKSSVQSIFNQYLSYASPR